MSSQSLDSSIIIDNNETAASATESTFATINESPAFIYPTDDSSSNGSSSTASLSPSSSSSPDPNENGATTSPQRQFISSNKYRVTFGLHRNEVQLIEPYTDNWLSRAELKAIRCDGICEIEKNRSNFQWYLQTVDAATIHIKYSKEYQPERHRRDVKYDDSSNQKELMGTLTRSLITGCNMDFRGLEHCSKDAKSRRTGRILAVSAIAAKHRLLYTNQKSSRSLLSKERQFRKYCEHLSYNSRLWAHYMAMIDSTAAMQEYATIPRIFLRENMSTKVPKIVVVPCSQKLSSATIIRRMLPTIQLLQPDHNSRRGYQRLAHGNDESFVPDDDQQFVVYPATRKQKHNYAMVDRSKKAKTIFRKAIQRLKSSMEEIVLYE